MDRIFKESLCDDILHPRNTTEVENEALLEIENILKLNGTLCPSLGDWV
jgi:hypothetical protein